ncbi:hypothetical protein MANES_16G080600v8 [Manihot esculenta]|uniref:MPN domain-containing protein n=1 Tax=Manihot esculenta TaxID=3983 RepID=A0A2C9UBA4_MANES|nr:hypothetical protein MANES_16G080600v8 [Manihot esculenta]
MGSSMPPPTNDVVAGIFPEFLVETDLEADLSPEFPIKEEMIEEVMQELYREITCTETAASPSSETILLASPLPPPPHLSAPSFVNSGKSESCGASVSNSTSSVMAGVEFAGCVFGNGAVDSVELRDAEEKRCNSEEEEEEYYFLGKRLMDGCDGIKFGDEWLEKVMGWAPLELEGWS